MTLPSILSASRLAIGLVLGALVAVSSPGTARAQDPGLRVVASFSVIADMAARVGGDRVAVDMLVGPNEDTHVYQPTPADAARVAAADVVLVNGLGFEGFLDRLIEASATKATVVALGDAIAPLPADEEAHHGEDAKEDHAADDYHGHHHGGDDPHTWHSVDNARAYVAGIADAFCAADVQGCEGYRANATTYSAELAGLDAEIRASLADIPEDRRTIITSHDAFAYLAHAYGLTMLAPQGISTESEASAADVARLIDQIRSDGASAVFVENVANPRLIERIAAETGLKIGGTLYGDALSGADGPAPTYIDMMRHNTSTIAGALAGG